MGDTYHEGTGLLEEEKNPKSDSLKKIEKVVIKWENVNFTIKDDEKPLQILQDISGFANPQEILAIMGGSGSGKTSFLSILSDQLNMQDNFDITGDIKLNNKSIKDLNSSYYIRYIPQESILFEFLTPYEFLKFTLSLKTNDSKDRVKQRVESIIKDLGLTKVAHTIIGDTIVRGLSGGEKKRVCIAAELMLYPSILILDEPTSGLDSYISKQVISMLKDVLSFGVTVIMTIHQPSYDIFNMFDRLVLMQGGKFIYQGKAIDSIEYFNQTGFEIPKLINPPEYYMKILRVEDRNHLSDDEIKIKTALQENYKTHEKSIWNEINPITENDLYSTEENFQSSLTKSVGWLFWRETINYYRNPLAVNMKLGQILVHVILCNLIFNGLEYDNEGVDNRKGAIVYLLFVFFFIPNFTISMNIAYERHIIMKELKERLYGVHSYFLTKLIMEIPVCMFTVGLLVFGTYFFLDLNDEDSGKVLTLFLIGIVMHYQGAIVGIFAGAISKTPIIANAMGATISSVLMVFSGFFNDPETGPDATNWLRFFTPFYFLRNAALINEFDDLDYDDDVNPEPEERYNYDGTIVGNILISFIHIGTMYFAAYAVYRYQIHKMSLSS